MGYLVKMKDQPYIKASRKGQSIFGWCYCGGCLMIREVRFYIWRRHGCTTQWQPGFCYTLQKWVGKSRNNGGPTQTCTRRNGFFSAERRFVPVNKSREVQARFLCVRVSTFTPSFNLVFLPATHSYISRTKRTNNPRSSNDMLCGFSLFPRKISQIKPDPFVVVIFSQKSDWSSDKNDFPYKTDETSREKWI